LVRADRTQLIYGIIITAVIVFTYMVNIGTMPLWNPDEPYYIEAAREMRESGDYITPHFNYEQRLNKPILFYWFQVISTSVFGYNEFAARFPSLLAGLGLLFLIYRLGCILYSRESGFVAFIIGATSLEVYVLSRQAVTDMSLAFFMTLALYGYITVRLRDEAGVKDRWYLIYIGTGLAVLTKGPVGLFLPAAIVFFMMLVERDFGFLKRMRLFRGILLFLLVTVPWYGAVLLKEGWEFFEIFIIRNNILRFLTPMYKHTGPIYYYIPILLLGFFPWAGFLFSSAYKHIKYYRRGRAKLLDFSSRFSFGFVFNCVWFLVFFIFFSLSGSKLPAYILGLFPAIAMITAVGFTELQEAPTRTMRIFHYFYIAALSIILVLIMRASFFAGWDMLLPALLFLIITIVLLHVFSKKKLPYGRVRSLWSFFVATAGFMIIFCIIVNLLFFPRMRDYVPIKRLSSIVEMNRGENTAAIAHRCFKPSMVFYSKGRVHSTGNETELKIFLKKHRECFMFIRYTHWQELSKDIRERLEIVDYGVRYRDRIRRAGDVFENHDDLYQSRLMLLVYCAGFTKP